MPSDPSDTRLHVVSRWVTPVSGKRRLRVVDVNVPILCGGVTVAPADLIVTDETGTVVIPLGVIRYLMIWEIAWAPSEWGEALTTLTSALSSATANGRACIGWLTKLGPRALRS